MGYWTCKGDINVQLLERCRSSGLFQWACTRGNNSDHWLAPVKEQLQLSSPVPKEPTDTAVCTMTASTSIRHPGLTATNNLGITDSFHGHSCPKLAHRLSELNYLYNKFLFCIICSTSCIHRFLNMLFLEPFLHLGRDCLHICILMRQHFFFIIKWKMSLKSKRK